MFVYALWVACLFVHNQTWTMDALKEEILAPKVRILVGLDVNAHHKNVDNLKTELSLLEQQNKDFSIIVDQKIADIRQQINTFDVKHGVLSQKRIHMLRVLEQTLLQIREIKEKTIELLSAHIEFWEKYFSQALHQSNIVEEKSLYSFLDFQNMTAKLFVQQEQLRQIAIQKEALYIVISREEYACADKEREMVTIQEKIQEKRKFNDVKDELESLDLEKEILSKEQELAHLQLHLYQKQLDFFNSKEIVIQERIGILQEQSKVIRNHLYIDVADVANYEQKAVLQHKNITDKKSELSKLRQINITKKLKEQEELDRLRARFKIKIQTLKHIEDLEFQAHGNSENFASFSVALQYAIVVTYDRMLTNIKIDTICADSQDKQAQITQETIKLLFDVGHGLIKDSTTFEKDRVSYKQLEQLLISDIKNFKDEMVVTQNNIKELQRLLAHIIKQQEYAKNNEPSGSGVSHKKWSETIVLLEQLIKQLEQQYEILMQNNELYEKIIKSKEETLESVAVILQEFAAIGVWHRSMSAMTWDAILNMGPECSTFLKQIKLTITSYFSRLTVRNAARFVSDWGVGGSLIIFFCLFLLFFGYSLLAAFLPSLFKRLIITKHDESDPLLLLHQLWIVFIAFLNDVFTPLYIWFICFSYESLIFVPVALLLLFY
ncbi:hypothetical protein KAZ82_01685, partial [Candidatus Babeliales bacterium]|nr:hypothetical protein [Candidatus Babeliales bacterium]